MWIVRHDGVSALATASRDNPIVRADVLLDVVCDSLGSECSGPFERRETIRFAAMVGNDVLRPEAHGTTERIVKSEDILRERRPIERWVELE
jgi:hypothetical protein